MTDSTQTTYEEATRCPKCSQPGNVRIKRSAPNIKPRGAMVHTVYCENQLCLWYNTCWMVQVNADGSIPPPQDHTRSPKVYQGFEEHDQMARDIMNSMNRQVELEKEGGGEVRNPFSR